MADAVQIMMEKMIPELEDLQQNKIFTEGEIRQIIESRREFEYKIKRIPLQPIDSLQYIKYELNLNALKKKRKQRLGLKKLSSSDHEGIKRVHSIFDRLLYKHKGRVDLWLEYIGFCAQQRSGKVLSSVISRALQIHPRNEAIWIEAASYELMTNFNVDSARVLMQRALRVNKNSCKLWLEYFRLELLYINKLLLRREILDINSNQPESDTLVITDLDIENRNQYIPAFTQPSAAREEVLRGAIPKVVYLNAIEVIPDDWSFRLDFLKICDTLDNGEVFEELSRYILDSTLAEFSSNEEVLVASATRGVQTDSGVIKRFQDILIDVNSEKNRSLYINWLIKRIKSEFCSPALLDAADHMLQSCHASDEVEGFYSELLLRKKGSLEASNDLLRISSTSLNMDLGVLYTRLQMHQKYAEAIELMSTEVSSLFDFKSLSHIIKDFDSSGSLFLITQEVIRLLINFGNSPVTIEYAFEEIMSRFSLDSEEWNLLRLQYIIWSSTSLSIQSFRDLYKRFLEMQLLPTSNTYSFLMVLIDVESTQLARFSVEKTRLVFERALDVFGRTRSEIWIIYIRCLMERGYLSIAHEVRRRASRMLGKSIDV